MSKTIEDARQAKTVLRTRYPKLTSVGLTKMGDDWSISITMPKDQVGDLPGDLPNEIDGVKIYILTTGPVRAL